jgi:acyl-CoA thioesterase
MNMKFEKYKEKINNDKNFIGKVGIECDICEDGHAIGKVKLDESNVNPYGTAHGGCIFSLADTIGGMAAMTRGYYVCTVSSSIEYLNAGAGTEYLHAEAIEIKDGRTISVYDVLIRDDQGNLIAKSTLNYYKLKPIPDN